MNMALRMVFAACAALLLGGCVTANQMVVQIDCVPSGALVYEGNRAIGQCPAQISYPVTPFDRQMGVVETPPLTARWASGAEQTLPGYRTPVDQGGYRVTFSRPEDAPDLGRDLAASAEWERTLELQAQTQAMREQAQAVYFHQLAMERHYRALRRGYYGYGYGWGGRHYHRDGGGRPSRPDPSPGRPNDPPSSNPPSATPPPSSPPPAAAPAPPPAFDGQRRPGVRPPPPDRVPEKRKQGRPGLRQPDE